MKVFAGATRTVIVTRRYAFKLPRFYRKGRDFEWQRILYGLIANLQERHWSRFNYSQLCPVLFADPIGLLVVMPRCEVLADYGSIDSAMSAEEFERFIRLSEDGSIVPVENMACNFGYLDGRLVSFDYGT